MVTLFLVGIVVAFIVDETTGIMPGGYIVPGYLALVLLDPWRMIATLAVAFAVLFIVRGVDGWMVLYGRRRFAFSVLTSALLKSALVFALPLLGLMPVGVLVVGAVTPGLLAEWMRRQGAWKTLLSAIGAAALTRMAAFAIGAIG